MPKHKGTDNLRAELNSKISRLKKQARKKPQVQRVDLYTVPKEGIGQVVLMGPPNSGKSTVLAELTNAKPEIAAYPFTTSSPGVGMIEYENVQIQLVDTPPLNEDFHPPWLLAIGRSGDILIGVVDGMRNVVKKTKNLFELLEEGKMFLETEKQYEGEELMAKPGFLMVNRTDKKDIEKLKNKYGSQLEIVDFSSRNNSESIKKRIYELLGVIRVYTKAPGKDPDFSEPVVLDREATVGDAAYEIHKDFAEKMKYTRLWRDGENPRRVGSDHILKEGDIVEFHSGK